MCELVSLYHKSITTFGGGGGGGGGVIISYNYVTPKLAYSVVKVFF